MATIYTHYTSDEIDYYLSLDSMTGAGYFPLTVMQGDSHEVTLYDDISTVTGEISKLLMKNAGMSLDAVYTVMDEIREYFKDSVLEVWADEDEPPYLLDWDDDDDDDDDVE